MPHPYTLKISTPPTAEPVTVAEAKDYARIDATADDALVAGLIVAAREAASDFQGRAYVNTVYRMTLDEWPETIVIPRSPLVSVSSIAYLDADGESQTLAADQYRVDTDREPARITPAYGVTWPILRGVTGAVTVTFTAGYGTDPGSVPAAVRLAVALGVAHRYEDRAGADWPPAFYALLSMQQVRP